MSPLRSSTRPRRPWPTSSRRPGSSRRTGALPSSGGAPAWWPASPTTWPKGSASGSTSSATAGRRRRVRGAPAPKAQLLGDRQPLPAPSLLPPRLRSRRRHQLLRPPETKRRHWGTPRLVRRVRRAAVAVSRACSASSERSVSGGRHTSLRGVRRVPIDGFRMSISAPGSCRRPSRARRSRAQKSGAGLPARGRS